MMTMNLRALSDNLMEKAKKELNEDPKRIENDLKYIKNWLEKQPHLHVRRDDQWLIAFLRGCKFSLERTKEKIDLYYSLRSLAPELHAIHHNDRLFQDIMGFKTLLILPKLSTPDSPRVALIRPGEYDPYKTKITDILSASNVIQKLLLIDDDDIVVNGVRIVIDLKGVTMGHFLQMTPAVIKKMVVMGQDATPLRVKGSHYLNTPPGFETIFNTIKSFLNEKNKNRLYVHNKNYDELYKYVPKDVLPEEYGGTGGTADDIVEYWKDKVSSYSSWLEDDLKYGTDEKKRIGRRRTAETLFGLHGSFRQLQFD